MLAVLFSTMAVHDLLAAEEAKLFAQIAFCGTRVRRGIAQVLKEMQRILLTSFSHPLSAIDLYLREPHLQYLGEGKVDGGTWVGGQSQQALCAAHTCLEVVLQRERKQTL